MQDVAQNPGFPILGAAAGYLAVGEKWGLTHIAPRIRQGEHCTAEKRWEQPGGAVQPAPARRVRFYRGGTIYRGTDGPPKVPEALLTVGKRGHAGGVQA